MKKLIKITSGVALMFILAFTLSSFTSNEVIKIENNGVDVVVIKDGGRWILVGCDDGNIVLPTSSTDQYKNGELHMSTYIWDVPVECSEAPKKTEKGKNLDGTLRWLFNPSGKYILKEIYN
ncbi:hypothetical protein [Pontimicrobium aquaticum]|uniref:Uncharacterized protein n=1 Tax=Pontimicrobium aquaticum TaxID=2565367 RepID=A0A4U0ESP0_9FLAO|nr:hypothetical protein [Pontimicrobium aquaticum]TJY33352.1 hypothetical protein E5167_12680 [Pontimicrobium aquaticum]